MQEKDQGGAGKPVEQGDERSALTAFDTENPGAGEVAASGGDASPDALPERKSGELDKAAAQCPDTGASGERPLPYIPCNLLPQVTYRPSPAAQKLFKHTAEVAAGPSPKLLKIATSSTAYKPAGLTISEMQKDLASRMEALAARVTESLNRNIGKNIGEGIKRAYWKAKRQTDERRLKKWGRSLYQYRVRYGENNEFKATQKAISKYVFEKRRGGVCEGNEERLGYIESANPDVRPINLPELFRLADAYKAPPMLIIGETTEDEELLLKLYRNMDDKRKKTLLDTAQAFVLASATGAGEGEE